MTKKRFHTYIYIYIYIYIYECVRVCKGRLRSSGSKKFTWWRHICFFPVKEVCGLHEKLCWRINFICPQFMRLSLVSLWRCYPATLINNRFEFAEKKTIRRTTNPQPPTPTPPKNHINEQSLTHISAYNKNKQELFTEILKNQDQQW